MSKTAKGVTTVMICQRLDNIRMSVGFACSLALANGAEIYTRRATQYKANQTHSRAGAVDLVIFKTLKEKLDAIDAA